MDVDCNSSRHWLDSLHHHVCLDVEPWIYTSLSSVCELLYLLHGTWDSASDHVMAFGPNPSGSRSTISERRSCSGRLLCGVRLVTGPCMACHPGALLQVRLADFDCTLDLGNLHDMPFTSHRCEIPTVSAPSSVHRTLQDYADMCDSPKRQAFAAITYGLPSEPEEPIEGRVSTEDSSSIKGKNADVAVRPV